MSDESNVPASSEPKGMSRAQVERLTAKILDFCTTNNVILSNNLVQEVLDEESDGVAREFVDVLQRRVQLRQAKTMKPGFDQPVARQRVEKIEVRNVVINPDFDYELPTWMMGLVEPAFPVPGIYTFSLEPIHQENEELISGEVFMARAKQVGDCTTIRHAQWFMTSPELAKIAVKTLMVFAGSYAQDNDRNRYVAYGTRIEGKPGIGWMRLDRQFSEQYVNVRARRVANLS